MAERALPPPIQQAMLAYARAASLTGKLEEAVFPGRWRDQPVDGKYIGEQLRQAAELAGIPLERPLHPLPPTYPRPRRPTRPPRGPGQPPPINPTLPTPPTILPSLRARRNPGGPSRPP